MSHCVPRISAHTASHVTVTVKHLFVSFSVKMLSEGTEIKHNTPTNC